MKLVLFSFCAFFFCTLGTTISSKSIDQVHPRFTRSLRMERSWTRSGYGLLFVYSHAFNGYELAKIQAAVAEIRKHSCIPIKLLSQQDFWSKSPQLFPNYVFIEKSQGVGCGEAFVGMQGKLGYQVLSLSPDPRCLTVTTIMHEIMHTLGIEHEQSRPDRNSFITVHSPNVQNGLQNVFGIAYGSQAYGPYMTSTASCTTASLPSHIPPITYQP